MPQVEPVTLRFNLGDRITMPVTIWPKWWQFWLKPYEETREFVLTHVGVSSGPIWEPVDQGHE
jgi:hypothetical protein